MKEIIQSIKRVVSTPRGRNVLTFIAALAFSALFWFLTVLNDKYQRDYNLEVAISGIPDDVTFLSHTDVEINVVVRDKGTSLARYEWFSNPKLQLSYSDFDIVRGENRMVLNHQRLTNRVRDLFGKSVEVIAVRPDSISFNYTTRPGERFPLHVNVEAKTDPSYVVAGEIKADIDSVTIYSVSGMKTDVSTINTSQLWLRDLTETTTVEVAVDVPPGAYAVPDMVKVTVPVEVLVTKEVDVRISTRNVPENTRLLTFPSTAKVTYLVPMSRFKDFGDAPALWVDYNEVTPNNNILPLHCMKRDESTSDVICNVHTVEYIIDTRRAKAADDNTAEDESNE